MTNNITIMRILLSTALLLPVLGVGQAEAGQHRRHGRAQTVAIPAGIDLATAETMSAPGAQDVFSPAMQSVVERQPTLAQGVASGGLKALVARHAAENGVPFALADAVVKIESGYNPHAANHSGALGLMQIKARTARGQGFAGSASALLDPDTNLRFAMRYLAMAYRLSGGDVCGTVMRYQSGHGAQHMSSADRSYCSKARRLMAQA